MQNTLIYHSEWIEMINTLPDENDRNALLAAIMMYRYNGQIITLSPALNLVFLFIKKEMDIVTQQIEAVEARKEMRRLKRATTSFKKTKKSEPSETSVVDQAEKEPRNASEPVYKAISPMPDVPSLPTSKPISRPNKPTSKNRNFNSILRAKERHDIDCGKTSVRHISSGLA